MALPLLAALFLAHLPPTALGQPPTIASLALPPLPERRLLALPQVQNFFGSVGLRRDLLSLGTMALTPYNGNFQNCSALLIDGAPVALASTAMRWFEGARNGSTAGGATVEGATRMPFEVYAVLQSWRIAAAGGTPHTASAYLDGPFFYRCDAGDAGAPQCGWGTAFPTDRSAFDLSLAPLTALPNVTAMVTVHRGSGTATASALWWRGGGGSVAVATAPNSTFALSAAFEGSGAVLQQAIAVGDDAPTALARLRALVGDAEFDAAWADAAAGWEARWRAAFQVPAADGGPGAHFAGSLPTLASSSPAIDRLYYWAAAALVGLERTNYLSTPRAFVISQGQSNSFDGGAGMGGSGQFIWDLSFAATTYSLLDPPFVRALLEWVAAGSDLATGDIPQCWDAYPPYGPRSGLARGSYRFDPYSAYLFFHQYTALNNGSAWLAGAIPGAAVTGSAYLEALARYWERFSASPLSPWLANYGSDKRDFLEVVPTYTSVVPALQFGSVGMLQAQARLYDAAGGGGGGGAGAAAALRANASAIFGAALAHLWRAEDGGAWRCAYANGSSTAVRSVTDYVYIPQALSLLGRGAAALPADVGAGMQRFFQAELFPPGGPAWVRALSLQDPLCHSVLNTTGAVEDLLVMRADWGCMGSYGGIPGLAMESGAGLLPPAQGAAATAAALAQLAPVAATSAPGQGIAVQTPPWLLEHWNGGSTDPANAPAPPYAGAWPEFFDERGFPFAWPDTERYVQNAEASICDAIIRTLFGWRPDWVTPAAERGSPAARAAIDAALWNPAASRGAFEGTLSNLRTPLGYINITAGAAGLSWVWA